MKINKLLLILFVLAVVFTWGITELNSSRQVNSSEKRVVRIGVTAPLTGDLAFMGEGFKNSIILAEKQLEDSKKNGKNIKYEYEVLFQDDGFDPVRGASAVSKFINVDHVDVVVSFGSSVGNAVSPIAEKAHVPHINAIASDPHVAIGDYNFIHWTPPEAEAITFLKELQQKGIKRITLFEQNQAGVLAVDNALRKHAAEYGVEIVALKKFNGGEKDFRTLIAEVKNIPTDLYVLEAMSPSLESLAKQLRSAGIKTEWSSIETFEYTEQMSLFEGSWYVYAADTQKTFIDAYMAAYGKAPVVGSPNGYDIFNFVVNASEMSSSPTAESIKNNLYLIQNQDSAVGKVSINQDGIVVSNPTVRIIENGKPKTLK